PLLLAGPVMQLGTPMYKDDNQIRQAPCQPKFAGQVGGGKDGAGSVASRDERYRDHSKTHTLALDKNRGRVPAQRCKPDLLHRWEGLFAAATTEIGGVVVLHAQSGESGATQAGDVGGRHGKAQRWLRRADPARDWQALRRGAYRPLEIGGCNVSAP